MAILLRDDGRPRKDGQRQGQRSRPGFLHYDGKERQLREYLAGLGLLIRGEIVLFQDLPNMHITTPASGSKGTLSIDFSANRERCEYVIKAAIETASMRQEAEDHLFWARHAAMELGSTDKSTPLKKPDVANKMEDLKTTAVEHLDKAEEVGAKLHSDNESLAEEIKEARRMPDARTASSERRMVMATTATGVGSMADKWYMCENAHPFSVKAGGAKRDARCHVCGAGVGGQSHVSMHRVTGANDLVQNFGGMAL